MKPYFLLSSLLLSLSASCFAILCRVNARMAFVYGVLLLLGFHILHTTPAITLQTVDAAEQPLFINEVANPLAFGLPMTAREMLEKRTKTSTVFDLGMGKRAAISSGSPLFTKDDNDQLVPIVQKGRNTNTSFIFDRLADDVHIRFDVSRPRYELRQDGHGYAVEFQADAVGRVENDTTIQYVLADGVTLRWSVEGNRVKKEIFIEKYGVTVPLFAIKGLTNEQVRLTDNYFSVVDNYDIERFSTVKPFLIEDDGTVIDRSVRITSLGDNLYRYTYDISGLPLPYILDPSEGPNNPGTLADDDAVGTLTWSNPGNADANDASYATVSSEGIGAEITHYLRATNFGFSIPGAATIDGIVVEIDRNCSSDSSDNCEDSTVQLIQGGTIQGDNNADTGTPWPTSDAYASYGGLSDTWGLSWTAANINASNFGVALSVRLQTVP